jgi:hypothetical protein
MSASIHIIQKGGKAVSRFLVSEEAQAAFDTPTMVESIEKEIAADLKRGSDALKARKKFCARLKRLVKILARRWPGYRIEVNPQKGGGGPYLLIGANIKIFDENALIRSVDVKHYGNGSIEAFIESRGEVVYCINSQMKALADDIWANPYREIVWR